MDRLGDSAKKGLDFIKSRAKETVEVQKLSSTLKQLEDRRERCLLDLGLQDRVEEANYLTQQIQKVKEEHESTREHLRQSVEDLMPKRSGPPIPPPDYD